MRSMLPLVLATAFLIRAQSAFEVVTVKPARRDATDRSLAHRPGARLETSNASLRMLILLAYQVMPFQLAGGPAWMASDGFDIEAKPADPHASPEQFRRMIQALLVDRFHLVVHTETREQSLYELVVAKNGTKLVEDRSDNPEVTMRNGRSELIGVRATMPMLAGALTRVLQRKVMDATGLNGSYTFQLRFQPEEATPSPLDGAGPTLDAERPSIFTALPEQLGLSLRSRRGPVEILVVDRAERPSGN